MSDNRVGSQLEQIRKARFWSYGKLADAIHRATGLRRNSDTWRKICQDQSRAPFATTQHGLDIFFAAVKKMPPASAPGKNPLAIYINRLLQQKVFPTRRALARAIGMSDSYFSRSVKDGRLTAEQCYQLAYVLKVGHGLKVDVLDICRVADRADLAVLIRKVDAAVQARDRKFIRMFRRARPKSKLAVCAILDAYADARGVDSRLVETLPSSK